MPRRRMAEALPELPTFHDYDARAALARSLTCGNCETPRDLAHSGEACGVCGSWSHLRPDALVPASKRGI